MARAHLEGESWASIARRFGVSKGTARRAARESAAALRPLAEGSLLAIEEVDVAALLAFGIEANAVALRRGLSLLKEADNPNVSIGAANAASRVLSGLVLNLLRLALLEPTDDVVLGRKIDAAYRELARVFIGAARESGVSEALEQALGADPRRHALVEAGAAR
jgi:hypothetical protein